MRNGSYNSTKVTYQKPNQCDIDETYLPAGAVGPAIKAIQGKKGVDPMEFANWVKDFDNDPMDDIPTGDKYTI